ncbi:hypothetical protein BB561_006066 [Smittium simulii]|uniref:GPI mannosyltransferase 2 n=1 Tax=Smittium simulii TaxID=133385 RepID=A0A2T9Y6T0_9FUNG|nr:hypothetical protein BB561_006066 [Smittium simulii]
MPIPRARGIITTLDTETVVFGYFTWNQVFALVELYKSTMKSNENWWSFYRGREVIKVAALSRLFVFGIAQFSGLLTSDYDSSFDNLIPNQANFSFIQNIIKNIVKVYTRWDSFYYLGIAQKGYTYEQEYAFSPMLPLIINFFANTVLYPLHKILGEQLLYMVSGILVANLFFVASAIALYRLGLVLFKNEKFAYLSTVVYCVSPANIFLSAM